MDRLPSATALARALLSLSRARATGVLDVHAPGRSAQLALVDGTPRAVQSSESDTDSLGDLLVREGSIDAARHAALLEATPPRGPVGAWLIEHGLATRPAVVHGLRRQLRRRVMRLFGWPGTEFVFRAGPADVGLDLVPEPVPTADLVLGAMRELVSADPVILVRRRLGHGLFVLSPLGAELVRDAALLPEEAAMVPMLQKGASVDTLLGVGGASSRAHRSLDALRLLGAIAAPAPSASYRLLLRKHRQVKNAEGAAALLEVPRGASPTHARSALRRLARDLHPDRFGDVADPAVRRASSEVLKALVEAEATLRAR